MAVHLDEEELNLYLWNDQTCYRQGCDTARREQSGEPTNWGLLVDFCLSRYRKEIAPVTMPRGFKKKMAEALKKDFMAHIKEVDEHEASRDKGED